MVGVYYCLPLEVRSESLPRVTVSNLPAGLSHNVAANKIEGVPKAAVTNRLVTVRAANVNKTVVTNTFVMNVLPLPAWAQGGFSGSCLLRDGAVPGMAEMTVSAQGAISGKLSAGGTNYTFKAGSYTNGGDFAFETVAVAGKAKIPLVVTVTHPEVYTGGPASLGAAEGWLDGAEEVNVALWRNVWKDADMAGALTNYAGYYTATLPGGGETGSGYLLLTLDAMGGVKVAGKLADGTSVSLSRTLILDPAGRLFVFCHTAPSGYKGGGFWAPVEIVRPQEGPNVLRVLEGNECRWESLDPLATDDYAAGGFSRKPGLTGGWYDKLGNLYDYYADRALEVGTAGGPGTPELILNGERVEAAWWDPAGIALTPVTNRYGVMTGLAAPKATSPVKIEGVYDYDETTNTVGLTVSLTRATGVFKGKFKVWFDAGTTHTYKQVAYEGALTPVRADPEDGIEGRGFFLWPDKAAYLNAQNKLVSYGFNWSYDFLILLQ